MKKELILLGIMILIVLSSCIFLGFKFKNKITGRIVGNKNFEKGFVSKVIDGDTVVINGESIRLLGIDADERGYECYNQAKKRLEELVLNKEILMESDERDKDIYERYLRYLFVEIKNGKEEMININLKLVEEGFAIARFYENKKYKKEIINAEQVARENNVGCKWKS